MTEDFQFRSPLGVLGRVVDVLIMTRYLKRLMARRNAYLKRVAEDGSPLDGHEVIAAPDL
jgi:hypothetical protein